MKKIRRLASVLLALVMVMGLGVTVMADGPYTITINNSADGYEYTAYQIFAGDLSDAYSEYTGTSAPTDGTQLYTYDSSTNTYTAATYDETSGATYYYISGKVLANIIWGSNISTTRTVNGSAVSIYTELAEISVTENSTPVYPFKDTNDAELTTAAEVAAALANYVTTDNEVAQAFAEVVSNYITGSGTVSTQKSDKSGYNIDVSAAGYYLVKTTAAPTEDGAYTRYILTVTGSAAVNTKSDVPTVVKKVKEKNDATGTSTEWQDAADYDIKDSVPFQLTATLPDNYADYDTYQLVFHDTLSAGFTFDNSSVVVTVYADENDTTGTVVKTGYTVVSDCYHEVSINTFESGTTYYIYDSVNSRYQEVAETSGSPVTGTTYYVKADCTFEVQIGNTNVLYEDSGSSPISVTSASTIVVTYNAALNDNATIGAEGNPNQVYLTYSNNPNSSGSGSTGKTPADKVTVFTYELVVNKVKKGASGTGTEALAGAEFTLYKQTGTDANTSEPIWTELKVLGTDGTASTFTFTGLDAGTYKLSETKTPTGYNTADDIVFNIVSSYDTASDNPQLTSLTVTDSSNANYSDFTIEVAASAFTGRITTSVLNQKGATLPSAGGIGTTIFYIIGGLLVFGAAVLLIVRRGMSRKR